MTEVRTYKPLKKSKTASIDENESHSNLMYYQTHQMVDAYFGHPDPVIQPRTITGLKLDPAVYKRLDVLMKEQNTKLNESVQQIIEEARLHEKETCEFCDKLYQQACHIEKDKQ